MEHFGNQHLNLQNLVKSVIQLADLRETHQLSAVRELFQSELSLRNILRKNYRPKTQWNFSLRHKRALLSDSSMFDSVFFLRNHPEIALAGIDPLAHYLKHGQSGDLDPHPLFCSRWYLDTNPDVAEAGLNPLLHFIEFGTKELRSPHPLFDLAFYLNEYPDVAQAGINPLVHYILYGGDEGRRPHRLFDPKAYLELFPEISGSGMTPLEHYCRYGSKTTFRPHRLFDPVYYLINNPDVLEQGHNPLVHYLVYGAKEGRNPGAHFSTEAYLNYHSERSLDGMNPLVHFASRTDHLRTIIEDARYAIQHVEDLRPTVTQKAKIQEQYEQHVPKPDTILLVSYYCPTRAHAGGLRILDLYAFIKLHYPKIKLELYTFKRPEIDSAYDDLPAIFDAIYFAPTDSLSLSWLETKLGFKPMYNVVDLQFHQAAYEIDSFRTVARKLIFTPMEALSRSYFLDIKSGISGHQHYSLTKSSNRLKLAIEELEFATRVDETVCVSRTDAAFIRAATGNKRVRHLETGISKLEFPILANGGEPQRTEQKNNIVLFVAYFGSETNITALKWFLEHVHPLIKAQVPDYIFEVVGRGDLTPFSKYQDTSIRFIGPVSALSPYISQAKVGIAPALGGSGYRGKINQYSIFGVPCVASPTSASGLIYKDGYDIFVATDAKHFADRCIELLVKDDVNRTLGSRARTTCFNNYTWESKSATIAKIYNLNPIDLPKVPISDKHLRIAKKPTKTISTDFAPKITALVPSYNHGCYLRQRIESIMNQSYENIELIVIDDCSPDDSDKVITSLREQYDFQYIRNRNNSGTPFAAWEQVAALATGEYIWICESDDFAAPDFLAVAVDRLRQAPDAALFYSNSLVVDEQGNQIDHTEAYFHNIWNETRWDTDFIADGKEELTNFQIRGQTVPNMSSAVISTSAFRKSYAPVLKKFKLTGDWLFIGLLMQHGPVIFCKDALSHFRKHEVTSRVRVKSALSQAEYVITKYLLYRETGNPISGLAHLIKTDAIRFIYEPAGLIEVIRALCSVSFIKTLQLTTGLAISVAANPSYLIKFYQRYHMAKEAN